MVRQLPPWHENISKRQVKAPKIFVADSGLLHGLLNLPTISDLECHPKVGASWEGFVMQQIIRQVGASPNECFFWATHTGADLDLLIVRGRIRLGFEIKRTSSPKTTRSMHSAIAALKLPRLDVVHAGGQTFPLSENIRAVSVHRILKDIQPLD